MTKETDKKDLQEAQIAALKQEPKKQAQKVAEAPKEAKKEATIYVGPALQGGKLGRYTIFKGGDLLPNVAELAKEHKSIKALIVPVSKLSEVERRLKDPTSIESVRFKEAGKIFSQGGK